METRSERFRCRADINDMMHTELQRHSQPMAKYLKKSQPEIRGSRALRGGLLMMSRSGGLKPSAVAGRPSVTRLTQSSWTGIRASGKPSAAVKKMLHKETI